MSSRASQVQFLKLASQQIPKGVNAAQHFAEAIDVGVDSMYRRMRGDSALSMDEACTISKLTSIPLDSAKIDVCKHVMFDCGERIDGIMDYAGIFHRMNDLMDNILNGTNPMIYYVSLDIPFFYAFPMRAFSKLKALYWGKVILNLPEMQNMRFNDVPESNEQQDLGRNLYRAYYMTPSVELWTKNGLYNNLRQVEYAWDSGMFSDKMEAMDVLDDLENITHLFQRQVKEGRKINPITGEATGAPLQTYYSELIVSNNTVLVETDQTTWNVVAFNTFNMMVTQSQHYSNLAKPWMELHLARSIRLESEKQLEVDVLVQHYLREITKTRQYIEFKASMLE